MIRSEFFSHFGFRLRKVHAKRFWILHNHSVPPMGFSYTLSFRAFPLHLPPRRPQSRTTPHGPTTFHCRPASMPNSAQNSNLFRRRLSPDAPVPHISRSHLALRVHASNGSSAKLILTSSAATAALAVANRVLYKLALVPMKDYPFFLAQLSTFGYVAIYFLILYLRYRAGIVTDEMLALPKWRFMAIGMLEALGVATGMSAGAMLPGPAIPILSQTFLVWQLAFSAVLLRRTYTFNQITGCLLVATGVVVAVAGGSDASRMLSGVQFVWPTLMIASSAFQAGASVIKEYVFIDAVARMRGKSLDIFVVNSLGSGFQALFVLLFLPFLSKMKGIPLDQLPSYLKSGAGCFRNFGANLSGCDGAPLLPLLYITTNLAFNIFLLNVVKTSSALVASLAVALSVPISIYLLSLPLPYLPEATSLSPFFLFGSVILVSGLILNNISRPSKQDSDNS